MAAAIEATTVVDVIVLEAGAVKVRARVLKAKIAKLKALALKVKIARPRALGTVLRIVTVVSSSDPAAADPVAAL